jgi:hypothetical protein
MSYCAGILEQSIGARNRGIGLSYRPARQQRLAESIPWNRFLGSLKVENTTTVVESCIRYCPRKLIFLFQTTNCNVEGQYLTLQLKVAANTASVNLALGQIREATRGIHAF